MLLQKCASESYWFFYMLGQVAWEGQHRMDGGGPISKKEVAPVLASWFVVADHAPGPMGRSYTGLLAWDPMTTGCQCHTAMAPIAAPGRLVVVNAYR